MAHQTGITASDELQKLIAKALEGQLRMLQVFIDSSTEKLVPGQYHEPHSGWEDDYDNMVGPSLNGNNACYVFYRLDERNAHDNFVWIFLAYVPNDAPRRDKMLYAATKATLKSAFTSSVIVNDIYANSKQELTLAGYRRHANSSNGPPPLTRQERELKQMREEEDPIDVGTSATQSILHGVEFPIEPDALEAIANIKTGTLQYAQLKVDVDTEQILLTRTERSIAADDLHQCFPENTPRYHFYLFKHTHEGYYQESIVFIYICPGYPASIKERMLYASCKQPLARAIESQLGINIVKKIELDSPEEVNEKFLLDEVHPTSWAFLPKFTKPKPPGKRARMRQRK